MVISGFEELKGRLGDISPVPAVVAAANDRHTLQAVFAASRDGVIRPILVGERTGLNDLARELGHPLSPEQIVDGDGPEDCASKAVALIRQGRGSCCQKKSRSDGQDQACFLTFFHSVTPLADLLQITQNHGQNHSDHQKNADHCCNGFLCFFIVKIHHSFHLLIFPYREIMLSIIRDASLLVSFSGTASVSIL